jgi:hypothetical protein
MVILEVLVVDGDLLSWVGIQTSDLLVVYTHRQTLAAKRDRPLVLYLYVL